MASEDLSELTSALNHALKQSSFECGRSSLDALGVSRAR
jgi:hypothetical protein